jgi:ABC-type phosphate transport system substrate-binding protein
VNKSVTTTGGTTITNLSTAELKMIFAGVIKDWSQLQSAAMTPQPVAVCLRHAGSGTHATMDAFMRPQTVLKTQLTGTYNVYFNDGSSDLMRCVNGSGSWSGTGAIGYADSDQALTSYPNTSRITIDNVQPTTANVDDYTHSFTSIQNLYASTANAANNTMIDLCTYASQPSTITAVNPNWSASCNMKHIKNSNFSNWVDNPVYHNSNCN